jgi:uncharacterized UPF0146 family protein
MLGDDGISGQVHLVGGGVIALAHGSDRITSDFDDVFEPKVKIYEVASVMAQRYNLQASSRMTQSNAV